MLVYKTKKRPVICGSVINVCMFSRKMSHFLRFYFQHKMPLVTASTGEMEDRITFYVVSPFWIVSVWTWEYHVTTIVICSYCSVFTERSQVRQFHPSTELAQQETQQKIENKRQEMRNKMETREANIKSTVISQQLLQGLVCLLNNNSKQCKRKQSAKIQIGYQRLLYKP